MGWSATVAINERSNEERARGRDIFKLGLGQSPFPVPEHVREALARDQDSALIRFHLGIALQEYGSGQAARNQLERALELGLPVSQREQAESRLVLLPAS